MGRYAVCSAPWHGLLRVEEALRECIGSQHLGGQLKGIQGQQRLHKKCEASLVHWGTLSQTNKYTKRMRELVSVQCQNAFFLSKFFN